MSRLEDACNKGRNIPDALAEDEFHLPCRNWRKLQELKAHKELEQLRQLYFALLTREEHEKQDMPERNLSGRKNSGEM